MSSPIPRQPTGSRFRSAGVLLALATLLALAFGWLPAYLAGASAEQRGDLGARTGRAVVSYWQSGQPAYPPELSDLVDYWRRFHLVKAMIAVALLIALTALTKVLWLRVVASRRRGPALAATAAGLSAFGASLLVLANIQGAVSPFSSLLSTLPLGRDRAVDGTAAAIHRAVAGGSARPPWGRMVDDFGQYHAVVAVGAGLIAIILVGMAVLVVRRSAQNVLRRSRVAGVSGLAILMLIVCLANTATASNPAPALELLFTGR